MTCRLRQRPGRRRHCSWQPGSVLLLLCLFPLGSCASMLSSGVVLPVARRSLAEGEVRHAENAQAELGSKLASVAVHNTVVITQTNCGFLPFAENWLYHASRINLTNFLVISEDAASTSYLEERYPGHTLAAALLDSTRPQLALDTEGFQDFGSKQFIQLACARPVYMQAVLAMGYNLLWIDLDAALLVDPFKYLPWLYEYVGVDDHVSMHGGRDSDYLCTCFMFLRPTPNVRSLLSDWSELCSDQKGIVGNQINFNKAMQSRQNASSPLDYYILPKQLYPDGWNFRRAGSEEKCGKFWRSPFWTHANYISGFDKKRKHFQELGLWHGGLADHAPQC